MQPLDEQFREHWRSYLWQSLAATLAVFIVLLLLRLRYEVIIASIGATAFIVFTMPNDVTARARNVIGGHLFGLLSGSLLSLVPHGGLLSSVTVYALAVGISMFLMVVTDTEHLPAAGTALGVAISGFLLEEMIVVVGSVCLLALIHRLLGKRLRDLV